MGKQCSSFDKAIVIWWATAWCAILGSWPAVASAAPLSRRQQNGSSTAGQQQDSQASQALIIGLSAGFAVVVLTGITLIICFPPRKWARSRSARPVTTPWIKQTTTTTVTTQDRSSSSDSSDSLIDRVAPLPMARLPSLDSRSRSRYMASKETVADAASEFGGPSGRRLTVASLQRYSVHVTSDGSNARFSRDSEPLSHLPEVAAGAPKLLTSEILPVLPIIWPYSVAESSPSKPSMPLTPGKSHLADRRGRPALQSIQVPPPPSPASVKGKGKARMYYH